MDAFVFAVTRLALGRFSTASSPVAPTERLSMRRSSTSFLRLARGFPASFLGTMLPREERRILMNADFTTCHALFSRDRPNSVFAKPSPGPFSHAASPMSCQATWPWSCSAPSEALRCLAISSFRKAISASSSVTLSAASARLAEHLRERVDRQQLCRQMLGRAAAASRVECGALCVAPRLPRRAV